MLANELNGYKERENSYVDENIQEIQELYTNEGQQKKEKGRIEKEEVILIKPYDISSLMSSSSSSFANEEVNNLLNTWSLSNLLTQTRIFWPLPHYQSLWSRGEQDTQIQEKSNNSNGGE